MTLNIVKIGGSLSQNPKALKALCQKLSLLSGKHQIVVVPGGGEFADCVRDIDKRFSLSETAAHRMAILGMDQFGLLLADLTPNCQVVNSLEEAKNASVGMLVVLLPSKFMFLDEELPNSWEVTSDSIAAYIAEKLCAKKLLLIKDVDGIFEDNPKKNTHTKLLEHLTTKELSERKNKTCTDYYLPKQLETLKIDCQIVNGLYPDRIEAALNNQKTTSTIISV
ncbi:MAG: hypothetical protein FWG55_07100 [Candidatus Bathyarchaeota archaeon]|nr:hypothetical protein [Candidatus Termiticorpusculum sp.]